MDPDFLHEIRNKYGSVFQTSIKNQEIIFRELTFAEYDKINEYQNSKKHSSADIEEMAIKFAVVYPENFDFDNYPAGVISSLAEEILEESGFSSARRAKYILESMRQKSGEVRNLMKAFVLATMPRYSVEDLDNMTFTKLAENVALAEKIIEIQQGINGIPATDLSLQLIDPEEEKQKENDFANRFNSSRTEGEAKFEDPIAKKLWGS
jgi:hypothetical protein